MNIPCISRILFIQVNLRRVWLREKKKLFVLIFIVCAIYFSFISFLFLYLICYQTNEKNDDNVEEVLETYKFLRLNEQNNITFRGFLSTSSSTLGENGYISYEDFEGNYVLVSNFGLSDYKCSGICYCNDERRLSLTIMRVMYLVSSVSLAFAYHISKNHFEQSCEDKFKCFSVGTEVHKCEKIISEAEREIDDEYRNFRCRGYCLEDNRTNEKYLTSTIRSERKNSLDIERRKIFDDDLLRSKLKEDEFLAIDRESWSSWLEENHDKEKYLWLVKWKIHTKRRSITWEESFEEALSYGWVDGKNRKMEHVGDMYKNDVWKTRFNRRRIRGTTWAKYSVIKARQLIEEGRMKKAGLEAYQRWIDDHPEDEDIERERDCGRIKQNMNVLVHRDSGGDVYISGSGEEVKLEKDDWLGVARLKFMDNELHNFCKHAKSLCVGHENFINPSVKCVETFL